MHSTLQIPENQIVTDLGGRGRALGFLFELHGQGVPSEFARSADGLVLLLLQG